jgi:CDP-L-myo-inositol myo-inositolphosphotransferase
VVLGYEANLILDALKDDPQLEPIEVTWLHHEQYELNNGVSVLQAAPHVDGEFYLTMADHVLEPSLYHSLVKDPMYGDLTLAVDYKLAQVFDMDDATKVKVSAQNQITEIDKALTTFDAVDIGLFRCTPVLFDALQTHFDEHGNVSLSEGVKTLADHGRAYVTDVGEGWWQDVDNLETRTEAERRLFVSLTKSIDGPVSKHINRRFSKWVTRQLMSKNVTPNHMTTVGLIIGLLSAVLTALAGPSSLWLLPLGGFLYQVLLMIDGCDGEIARLKFLSSDWGEWYDTISDDVINLSYQLALGFALYNVTGQPIWFVLGGVGFVLGGIVSVQLYRKLIQEGAGTHLALSWSFEEDQSTLFQKICARCSFVARRDFYALALMCFSFLGIATMQFGLGLNVITICFVFGQWYLSEKSDALGTRTGVIAHNTPVPSASHTQKTTGARDLAKAS